MVALDSCTQSACVLHTEMHALVMNQLCIKLGAYRKLALAAFTMHAQTVCTCRAEFEDACHIYS